MIRKLAYALHQRRMKKRTDTRLTELKRRLVEAKASYYDLRHWPDAARSRLAAQIEEMEGQIAHIERTEE